MSSDCAEEETKQWDYLCPQFCDLAATETSDQLIQIDHFFQVDHELNDQKSGNEEMDSFEDKSSSLSKSVGLDSMKEELKEVDNELKYETPKQNKENIDGKDDDNEDNEVFYSTKKSFTIEKSNYKLRSTPMRTLQYNGSTPLRESRISSKKKSNKQKKGIVEPKVFTMKELMESLPTGSDVVSETRNVVENNVCPEMESKEAPNEDSEVFANDDNYEEVLEVLEAPTIEVTGRESYVVASLEAPTIEAAKRESYVISSRPKTVQLISPNDSAKISESSKKRFAHSMRRRGTPLRKRSLSSGSNRKPSAQSIVSRLYSTTKKTANNYKTMAELLRDFENEPRGSDRSRSLDRGVGSGQRSRSSSVSSLTQPKSPKLSAIHRHRPPPRPTDDIIASEIKKYSFKANPIRKKLFDAKFASGIPRVKSVKAPTKAVDFHLLTEKRNQLRAAKVSANEDKPEDQPIPHFRANPMPAFRSALIVQKPNTDKKVTTFRPFSFDHQIIELVNKKRSNSEGLPQHIKNDSNRKSFRF